MAFRKPNDDLRWVARSYCVSVAGMEAPVEGHYVPVVKELGQWIAEEYERLETDASDQWIVAASYTALLAELTAQWYWLRANGYQLLPWVQDGQPYQNSEEMCDDLRNNRRLYFFTGGEPHPFLNDVTETGYTGNEMLRAVHDCFGHAAEGFGFGPRGEENAWIHHSMMFGPLAQRALSTETRGQNSWVNFGPNAHLPASERPYAEQKVDLLPVHLTNWREALATV